MRAAVVPKCARSSAVASSCERWSGWKREAARGMTHMRKELFAASGLPEVVTWRLSGSSAGGVIRFHLHGADQSKDLDLENASLGSRNLYLPDQQQYAEVPVFDRYKLPQDAAVDTPAVLVEPESTLIVAYPGKLRVLPGGTVEVTLAPATHNPASDQGDC